MMLKIDLRSRMKKERIDQSYIGQLAELFKCNWQILSPFEVSDRLLALWF